MENCPPPLPNYSQLHMSILILVIIIKKLLKHCVIISARIIPFVVMCMTRIITRLNMQPDLAKSFLLLQVYTRG